RHDFELGVAFQYAREDHVEKRVLDLARLAHADAIALDTMARLAVHAVAEAGENMEMHRKLEILRRRPETLVMLGGKGQARVRHLPDHRADDALLLAALHLGDGVIDIVH